MVSFINNTLKSVILPRLRVQDSETGEIIETPPLPRAVIISSVLINLLGLAMPLTILQVYDRILPNESTDTLLVLMLGLVVVLFLDATLKIIRSFTVGWLAASFSHKAHLEAIRRILYSRSDSKSSAPMSQQLDSLRSLQSLSDQYGSPARLLIVDLPASLMFLAVLFVIGGPVGFVPLILLAVFTFKTSRLNEKLNELITKRAIQDQRKYDFIIEILSGLSTIKSLALEPLIMRRFERLQKQIGEQGYDYIELSNNARNVSGLFTSLTTVFVVAVGAVLTFNGYISVGAVAACTLLAGQVVQPLLRGITHWTDMQRISHDFKEAGQLFETPAQNLTIDEFVDVRGAITLDNVSYQHASGAIVPLHDVSIKIDAGECIAFDGTDAGGRSTLMRLLSGDLAPTAGSIEIDGHDLFGDAQRSLRKQIAYVDNDAQVFSGSILQNLTLFGSQADPRKARLAADLIGLEKDIHLLPLGYDTMLGGGLDENLTGSFIQRIAIARALTGEPKVLLLDDANGALDMPGETALINALQRIKGQLTILIVSHRPSFRAIADRQLTLEGGRLKTEEPMESAAEAAPADAPEAPSPEIVPSPSDQPPSPEAQSEEEDVQAFADALFEPAGITKEAS
ncbi:peptidase domain-containing ABC transporter [Roseibium sp.]|uniref:peptidase domain-containing ABC transporter n=1 Tax=Roseibium sp. TaxID=1936156 RepID=UPI003A9715D1